MPDACVKESPLCEYHAGRPRYASTMLGRRRGRSVEGPATNDYEETLRRLDLPAALLPIAARLAVQDLLLLRAFFKRGLEAGPEGSTRTLGLAEVQRALCASDSFDAVDGADPFRAAARGPHDPALARRIATRLWRLRSRLDELQPTTPGEFSVELLSPTETSGYTLRVRGSLARVHARRRPDVFPFHPLGSDPDRPLLVSTIVESPDPAAVRLERSKACFELPSIITNAFAPAISGLRDPERAADETGDWLVVVSHEADGLDGNPRSLRLGLAEADPVLVQVTELSKVLTTEERSARGKAESVTLRDYLTRTMGLRVCVGWEDRTKEAGPFESRDVFETSVGAVLAHQLRIQLHVVVCDGARELLVCVKRTNAAQQDVQCLIDVNARSLWPQAGPGVATLEQLQSSFVPRELARLGFDVADLDPRGGELTWDGFVWAFRKAGTFALTGTLRLRGDIERLKALTIWIAPRTRGEVLLIDYEPRAVAGLIDLRDDARAPAKVRGHLIAHGLIASLRHRLTRDQDARAVDRVLAAAFNASRISDALPVVRTAFPYLWSSSGDVSSLAVFVIEGPNPRPDVGLLRYLEEGRTAPPSWCLGGLAEAVERGATPWRGFDLTRTELSVSERTEEWPSPIADDPALRASFDRLRAAALPPGDFDGRVALVRDFEVVEEAATGVTSLKLMCVAGHFSHMKVLCYGAEANRVRHGGSERSVAELLQELLGVELLGVTGKAALREFEPSPTLHPELPRHLQVNALVVTSDDRIVVARRNASATSINHSQFVVSASRHALLDERHPSLAVRCEEALGRELGLAPGEHHSSMRLLGLLFGMRRGGAWAPALEVRLAEHTFADVEAAWSGYAEAKTKNLSLSALPLHPRAITTFLRGETATVSPMLQAALILSLKFSPATWALRGDRRRPDTWSRPRGVAPRAWLEEVGRRMDVLRGWLRDERGDHDQYDAWLDELEQP